MPRRRGIVLTAMPQLCGNCPKSVLSLAIVCCSFTNWLYRWDDAWMGRGAAEGRVMLLGLRIEPISVASAHLFLSIWGHWCRLLVGRQPLAVRPQALHYGVVAAGGLSYNLQLLLPRILCSWSNGRVRHWARGAHRM